jgi:multiple antibiotic resistance protein
MSVFSIALALFLITNPIGNTPAILAIIKDIDPNRQRMVLLREALFSCLLAIFFLFLGDPFLNLLHVKNYTVSFSGGIILILVALQMIFPSETHSDTPQHQRDPFIVPIATPMLSGGGLLTTIMLYAGQEQSNMKILGAILLSSIGVTLVLLMAPLLQRLLKKRGMIALEQLMGMLLLMLSTELLVRGVDMFLKSLQ